ncbi:MAG TPA: glycoside hydrolase family 2 TIM barrel-domain containing protein [Armatimonadota bacterium]|nr:glycoside hydrolase family 2 TIM barrel-domain containing protein [Armatimonadota bacterium]
MDRERLNLDGNWKFMVSSAQRLSATTMLDMESIRVPSCWESELPGLVAGAQMAWYQRTVMVPSHWAEHATILHFGAVNYFCQIYLNGKLVGEHEGGYTPFWFRIDSFLQSGENLLEVAVTNPAARMNRFPYEVAPETQNNSAERLSLEEIPYGKQSWYGSGSGIWQSVWLEVRDVCHLGAIVVTPDVDRSEARVKVRLSEVPPVGYRVLVEITQLDPDSPSTLATSIPVPGTTEPGEEPPPGGAPWVRPRFNQETRTARNKLEYEVVIPMPEARLWSPETPVRYRALVTLTHGEDQIDQDITLFGMRKIEARDGRFFLNNREIYLIGALDQDFYPGTLYIPPSEEFLDDQFTKAKEMGLNLLRCHIKVPDPRYLHVADRLGILVWYEIPNWWTLTEKAMERAQTTIEAMIARDFNHPCVIIWTIVNEDWGTNLSYSPLDRQWVKRMYHHVKRIDPTRLVVDNSACVGNLHVESDIEDFHVYYSIPDHYQMWKGWVRDFSGRARWTYTQFGDAVRTYKEPLVVSEFGNWGLPSIRGLRETYGTDPSWMTTGQNVVYPYGTERRFAQYKLDSIYGTYDDFATATQWHQFRSMKFEIEEMRKYSSIVGYVITEFTDIHWECNGLLDMVRRRKAFHTALPQVNSPDLVMLDWRRVNYWSDEEIRLPLQVSHYGWEEMKDARVRWKMAGPDFDGPVDFPNDVTEPFTQGAGTVESHGELICSAPAVEQAERRQIRLSLENGDGAILNQNSQELFIFPERLRKAPRERFLWVQDPRDVWGLRSAMQCGGYRVSATRDENVECAVILRFDEEARKFASDGGTVLCLAKPQTLKGRSGALFEAGADLFENGSVLLTSRERRPGERIAGKAWDGDWATNFNWLKFREVCPSLAAQNPLGFQFLHIMPDYVILGYEAEENFADIYSGMVVGWVHSPVAMMAGARFGKGRVLVCTFKLEEAYGIDPAATVMMHDLIEFICSNRFQPGKEATGSVRMTAFMKAITEKQ